MGRSLLAVEPPPRGLSAEATVRVGTRMGDYQLMELVGEGGTGVVYRGRHAVTDLPVVIKVLHDHGARNRELVEQLVGVARAAGAVHHANLVALIDVGSTPEGTVFVVTEYLEGESLQARLQRVGRLQPFEAINILRQMAHGVGAAHEAGLVHGGLQPSNVFLCKRKGRRRLVRHSGEPAMDLAVEPETSFDQVTLLDLGVAGLVDGAAAAHYRSPEQAEGKPAGPSSDIYSLGAVFYEMVTGTAPADSLGKQVAGVTLASRRVPDAGLDGPIDDIILRCLKKTPRLRFAHTAALCEALDACVTDCAFLRDARPARLVSMTTKPSRAQGRAKPPPIPRPRPLARGRAQPPPIPRAGKTSSVSRKSPKQLIPLPKAARSSAVARGKPPPIPLTSDLLTELPER